MEPGRPPIDSFKKPVEDLELAMRLKAPAESADHVALEREGVAWANAEHMPAGVAHRARRRRLALVAVLVIVIAVALGVVLGIL